MVRSNASCPTPRRHQRSVIATVAAAWVLGLAIWPVEPAGLGAREPIEGQPAASTPVAASGLSAAERAGLAFFESKIRPVLAAHCWECHSAAAARQGRLKGDLRLDSRKAWERGGASGPAVVAGKPDRSLLLDALRHDGLSMPPDRKLPAEVIEQFADWIARGAPSPAVLAPEAAADENGNAAGMADGGPASKGPRRGMSVDEARRFWSFQPARPAVPPAVRDHSWPLGNVDQHVLAAIEQAGLAPAPVAEPRALVRRLHFDLLGLPPSPEDIDDFLAACEDDGYGAASVGVALERLVARLLASPRFGERWGRHWLDVARYADSNGRDRNVYFHHAYRYRDYVIAAMNVDLPYDRFVREQIAGDLLAAANPAAHAASMNAAANAAANADTTSGEVDRQRIATGFLALGGKAFEEAKPELFRMDVIDEQMDTMGRAILGLSIGCARCHDHKFDPLPTADYYALAGVFRSSQPLYGYGPKGIKSNVHTHTELFAVGPDAAARGPAGLAFLAELQRLTLVQNTARSDRYRVVRQVAAKRQELAALPAASAPAASAPAASAPAAGAAAGGASAGADERQRREAEIAQLEQRIKEWDVTVKEAEAALQAAFDAPPPQPGWAMGCRERPAMEDCRIHNRGEITNLGPVVARGVPRTLAQVFATSAGPDQTAAATGTATSSEGVAPVGSAVPVDASGRLQLAEWLTSPRNPLTPRVQVNRVWSKVFGGGIVGTPDDFGATGAAPSHPELLGDLAHRFMASGWSTKALIRELLLSQTYRQAASSDTGTADPENKWLARMRPRRLEAEAFRDTIKWFAGTLDGNPPPAGSEFLAKHNPYREDEYRTFKPLFEPQDIEHDRRSVYLPVIRGVLPPVLALFDFASPERTVAVRDESTVPAQALFLLNNPWMERQARAAARRLLADRSHIDDAARVDAAYQVALGRPPRPSERSRAAAFLATSSAVVETEDRWTGFCQALMASAEFRVVP